MIKFKEVNGGMGRKEYGSHTTPAHLFKVRINKEGYDSKGAYFGVGDNDLYCLFSECVWNEALKVDSEESLHFYRAASRKEAYEKALIHFPHLTLKVGVTSK